jgi:hypothetical protein
MADNSDIIDYDWFNFIEDDLKYRFPSDVNGFEQWVQFVENLPFAEIALQDSAVRIKDYEFNTNRATIVRPINCPRVFISHKQEDRNFALRIAELAVQAKFYYWLDILDPFLKLISSKKVVINSKLVQLSPLHEALLMAAVVEMALINCTHVLAAITIRSHPSRWIPYEYGRAKNSSTIVSDAACWVSPKVNKSDIAEYMLLGNVKFTDHEVGLWLKNEYFSFSKKTGQICKGGKRQWSESNVELEKLPDELS